MTQFSQFLNQFGLLTLPLWIKRENVSLFQAGKIRTLKDLFFISFATLCQAESILCDQISEISFELRMEAIFNVNDPRSFAMLLKKQTN